MLSLASARAAQITWTNTAGGNWNSALNWSPNQVPGASDTAVITNAAAYTVTLDVSPTVGGLTLGATGGSTTQTFLMNGQTFTLNGPCTVNSRGSFTVDSGSLSGTTNSSISGTIGWTGGILAGTLTFATNGTLNIKGGGGINDFPNMVLTNYGTVAWSSGTLRGGGGNTTLIYNYGVWDSQGDLVLNDAYGFGAGFYNFGTLRKSAGANSTQFQTGVGLATTGTLDVQTGTLSLQGGASLIGGTATNPTGIVQLAGGGFNINGTITSMNVQLNGGTLTGSNVIAGAFTWVAGSWQGSVVTVASNSVLNIQGGTGVNDLPNCVLTNYGTVVWSSGHLRGGGGNLTFVYNFGLWDSQDDLTFDDSGYGFTVNFINSGTLRKSVGANTATMGGGLFFSNSGKVDAQVGTLAFTGGGSFTGGTATNLNGIIQLAGGGFNINGTITSTNVQLNGGTLTGSNVIAGAFTWVVGSWGDANVTIAGNSRLNIVSGNDHDMPNCVFTNFGTVAWADGRIRGGGGNQTFIYNFGLWDAQNDQVLNDDWGYTTLFSNAGTFRKSGGTGTNATTIVSGVTFNNTGTVDVQTNLLSLQGGGSFSGGSVTSAGLIQLAAGAYTINGTLTTTNVQLVGGTLTGANVFMGGFTWVVGSWNSAGPITVTANSRLNIVSGNDHDLPNCIVTNFGVVAWADGRIRGGGGNQTLIYNYGLWDAQNDQVLNDDYGFSTLFSNAGTFRKSGGTGTNATTIVVGVTFNNTGTLDVQVNLLSLQGGGSFTGGSVTGAGLVQLAAGAYTINGAMTTTNVQLVGGTLAGANVLMGGFTWVVGSWNSAGPITITTNSRLNIVSGNDHDLPNCIVTNFGVVAWSDGRIRGGGGNQTLIYNFGLWDAQNDQVLNDDYGFSTLFSNAGTLRKSGGTGATSLLGGVTFDNQSGAIEVDSGQLSVGNNTYLQGSGLLTIKLGGLGVGQFGQLVTSSSALLGGPFHVSLANGFVPALGNEFQILACAGRSNTFTTLQVPAGISVNYSNNGVFLVVTGAVSTLEITGQPTNQTVAAGGTAMFTVSATGTAPLTYRWQKNGTNLTDGGNLFGSATSILTISNVSAANVGTYDVIVTNAAGSTLTSSNATLSLPPPTCSYTLILPTGYSLIANQCDHDGGNTLNNVFPAVPVGSQIFKFNNQTRTYEPTATFTNGGWSTNLTLNPGEGAYFLNSSNQFTLTISGNPHTPVLPLNFTNGCFLVSRQTNDIGTYENIIGQGPQDGDIVWRYVGGGLSSYMFSGFGWEPSDPMANVGESIWICRGGGSPPPFSTCVTPPSGLVGWWPGDGDATDISGQGNNGTLQGVVTFAAGKVGQAFSLNGTNAFVEIPNISALDPVAAGSQDAWVYFNQLPSVAGHIMEIIGKGSAGRDFDLQAETDNRFRFYIAGGTQVASTTVIQSGVWYHVAGTWDSTLGLKMYVNGSFENTNPTLVTRAPSGEPLQIGNQPYFGPRLFNGLIDEAEVFNRALSSNEVAAIFNAGSAGKCKPTGCALTCPTNIVATNTAGKCGTFVNYAVPTASGSCGAVTCTPTNGSFFPVGTTTVSCTTTGGASCSFTVTVLDKQNPTITCPTNLVLSTSPGLCSRTNVTYAVSAGDNCSSNNLVQTAGLPSGSTFPKGTTTNSFVLTDGSSNTASCSFTVTVKDTQAPSITCSSNIVANAAAGQTSLVVNFPAPAATDNCPGVTASCTPPSGSTFPLGNTTVTCVATDAAGNSNTCAFAITVNSTTTNTPPAIACPANISTNNAPGVCARTLGFAPTATGSPTPTITCKIGSTAITPPYPFPVGTTTVTCTASNVASTASCSFTVTITDTEPPVLTCPTNVTAAAPLGQLGATVNFAASATDNCDGPLPVACTPKPGFFALGQTPVTCEAVDGAGNRTTCTFVVTVTATTDPVRLCSLTQGFYGNAKGKFNGLTSLVLAGQLLGQGPLVVGKTGVRSLSILPGDQTLLEQRLPSGGPPATLPAQGDQTLQTAVLPLNSKGRFDDVFLGQTITLSLNGRLSSSLLSFGLTSNFCSQAVLAGPDGLKGTADDVLVTNDIQSFSIPPSVLTALSDPALGINDNTIHGLLELANRGLAGVPTGAASLPDINAAVDAINRGFDGCRRPPTNCSPGTITQDSFNDSFTNRPTLDPPPPPDPLLNVRVRSSNLAATKDPGEPEIAGNPGGKSVWWQWPAPISGPVTISTIGSSFDTLLGVYRGTALSNLVLVASNDDAEGTLQSDVSFQAVAGTNYEIAVDGFNGASGEIVLTLVAAPLRLCQPITIIGSQVGFCLTGEIGRTYTVEASPDLLNWTLIATALNSNGVLQFTDPAMSNLQRRFYRVTFEP